MNMYFSTFITGFDSVIEQALPKVLKEVKIELLSDGLVIYKTTSNLDDIKRVKFLNNSFILLKKVKYLSDSPIKAMLNDLYRSPEIERNIINLNLKKNSKFRIRASIENQFVAIDKNFLGKLEARVASVGRLVVDRSLPDIEFQLLTRREGFGLIGIRFTKRSNYEKTLERGELYPELTNLLCLISEPNKDDIFLDPFSGSGSIPIQRATSFPYKQIFAGDNDPILVDKLRKKTSKIPQKITVGKWDALHLNSFDNSSVEKIVTDPPWGLHSGITLNLPVFYSEMLAEFYRVTKVGGIIVVLTAQKELLETEITRLEGKLELITQYNTLVSGKKAGVYKIKRI